MSAVKELVALYRARAGAEVYVGEYEQLRILADLKERWAKRK